jgi:hypothetical protein
MTKILKGKYTLSVIDERKVSPPTVLLLVANATTGQTRAYEISLVCYRKNLDNFKSKEGSASSAINSELHPEVECFLKDTTNPREIWNILCEKLITVTYCTTIGL